MTTDYVHSELDAEVTSISGHYAVQKEVRLPCKGREALVVFGYAIVETSCCGAGAGCRFAQVPGFVIDWKCKSTPDGDPVSEVEPIEDETLQNEISELIDKTELYCQISFL